MTPRLLSLSLAALCLTFASAASAKKSHLTVKNCSTTSQIHVAIYNGDDAAVEQGRPDPRAQGHISAGEAKKWSCKVDSGKKRCHVQVNHRSKAIRVKDGRTLYVNRQADDVLWTNSSGCNSTRRVVIKQNGRFLAVKPDTSLDAQYVRQSHLSTWAVREKSPGSRQVSIRSTATKKYLSARKNGDVRVDRDGPRSAETYEMFVFDNGTKAAFKASNGKWLRVEGGTLKANANGSNSTNARFDLVDVE